MRTVAWIIEGKVYRQFEKREFFGEEGKTGKNKGLNLSDFRFVEAHLDEIIASLQPGALERGVQAEPAPVAQAAAPSHDSEEQY